MRRHSTYLVRAPSAHGRLLGAGGARPAQLHRAQGFQQGLQALVQHRCAGPARWVAGQAGSHQTLHTRCVSGCCLLKAPPASEPGVLVTRVCTAFVSRQHGPALPHVHSRRARTDWEAVTSTPTGMWVEMEGPSLTSTTRLTMVACVKPCHMGIACSSSQRMQPRLSQHAQRQ